jgi:beta-lactamase superfamily II metal-dependent hydrolase
VLETDTLDVGQKSPVLLKHEHKKIKSFAGKSESKRRILLLGSSHEREIGPMLQENLGTRFDVMSIFKPNATLAKVVEDLGKLSKDLTK